MKRYTIVFVLLTFAASFALTACQNKVPTPHEDTSPTKSVVTSEEPSVPETTELQNIVTEPTILTVPSDFEVRRKPEEITLYPFTDEELAAAVKVVQEYLDESSKETGVLTHEVESISYDPIMTDVHVRQTIAGAPVAGWTENDYYAHQISFAVTYSATYDHEKSPSQDVSNNLINVKLIRENVQAPWTFQASGVPVEEYSDKAMSLEELADVSADSDGRVLAGYEVGDDAYWFYLCDDATGKIQFIQQGS